MIQRLRAQNFKSWRDTGNLRLAPLTGLFGTNSSGKTSILQLLLMLKQTVESPDRQMVLNTGGDEKFPVDLGTFHDLIHGHTPGALLDMSLDWDMTSPLLIGDPTAPSLPYESADRLSYSSAIRAQAGRPVVERFAYSVAGCEFGMKRRGAARVKNEYDLISENFPAKRYPGRPWPLPAPVKCYGFPDETTAYYQNLGFLPLVVLALEEMLRGIAYLGPLRDYPRRSYGWSGDAPSDVGRRGQLSVSALLAARARDLKVSFGRGRRRQTVDERIAYWLGKMGMIDSYDLRLVAEDRRDYEVRVRRTGSSPWVSITDVGFGVSQILPVLVLCYYVPEGSTIILEQPEIHLHPSVQADLADVLIEAVNRRNLQIIVESHSEHLLRRLQRRIAEEVLPAEKTALYFCRMEESASAIEELHVDEFGYIANWPDDFFGNEMGELVAMTQAAMHRRGAAAEVPSH